MKELNTRDRDILIDALRLWTGNEADDIHDSRAIDTTDELAAREARLEDATTLLALLEGQADSAVVAPDAVFVVSTLEQGHIVDQEILDTRPRWDWLALNQVVRHGYINGGDSVVIDMPAENRGQ